MLLQIGVDASLGVDLIHDGLQILGLHAGLHLRMVVLDVVPDDLVARHPNREQCQRCDDAGSVAADHAVQDGGQALVVADDRAVAVVATALRVLYDGAERPLGGHGSSPAGECIMAERGDVLADRYRLIEPLGKGGMATVWRAEHVELGSPVAIKLIGENIADSESALTRFKREAKAAAALSSAHVVQIFDYGVAQDRPFIAMEVLDGENLAQRLQVRRTISAPELARVLRDVSRAIDKAHKAGILHRDMKPDNVFIVRGEEDGEETIKVLDFGVAKALRPDVVGNVPSNTRTGALIGSPYYMSPQQIRGQKTIDHRADLWSIGVIAYECLTGKRPFEGESLGDLVMAVCSDDIPKPSEHGCQLAGFDEWFAKACHRDPEKRFDSAREMYRAFQALLGERIADEDSMDDLSPPSAAEAAAKAGLATTVPTTPGLSRTQDGAPSRAAGRSPWGKVVIVVAFLAAATIIAVVALTRSDAETGGAAAAPTDSAAAGVDVEETAPSSSAEEVPPVTDDASAPSDEGAGGKSAGGASATTAPPRLGPAPPPAVQPRRPLPKPVPPAATAPPRTDGL